MARKPRIDSAAEQARIMAAAAKVIVPPATVPLDTEEMKFFDNIVAEFARSELSAHKLELVAILARTMSDLVREQQALKTDPSKKAVVNMHQHFVVALRRSLALHGRPVDVPAITNRRQISKVLERKSPFVAAESKTTDLISRASN